MFVVVRRTRPTAALAVAVLDAALDAVLEAVLFAVVRSCLAKRSSSAMLGNLHSIH